MHFLPPVEARRAEPWYPLIDWGWNRERCKDEIERGGLPLPRKSACVFCPYNQDWEWAEVRERYPEHWDDAIEMERRALPGLHKPEVVGLRRRGRSGERQLSNVPSFIPLEEVGIVNSKGGF